MRSVLLLLSMSLSSGVFAQACIVHSQGQGIEVQLCQSNVDIPAQLFREGFCAPHLDGQKTRVEFVEHCPEGAFGICRDARSSGVPYRQDIHYYGVASDARFLAPACAQQNQGHWEKP